MSNIQEQIAAIQQEIIEKRKAIVALRKELPLEEVPNYFFQTKEGEKVSLLDLFGDNDELLLIHNMGKSCVYCTMWADGMRGYTEMLEDKLSFVLTSPDAPDVMKKFAENRDWNFTYLSYHGTSFAHEMDFAKDDEDGRTWYMPGVSAFIKKEGKIYRTGSDMFGPGDVYCPPWQLFDLLPNGAGKWEPKYKY